MRDEFVMLDALRFRYREWGDVSAEPIVLLHGILLHADPFDTIAEPLSNAGRRVIVLDQRGHGQTDHADNYTWQSCERDLERFWDALNLGSVDVISHSWGGENACHLAALRPAAVKRLVLVENPLGLGLSADAPAYWASVARLAPADGFESAEEFIGLAQSLFPRAQRDALAVHGRSLVERDGRYRWQWPPDAAVLVAPGRNQPHDEMRETCGRVSCPVLVVRAEHSELFAAGDLDAVVGSFPSASATELADSGHMIMWENPRGVADLAIRYFHSSQ